MTLTLTLSQLCLREMCSPNVPQLCPDCAQTNFSLVCPQIVLQLCPYCASTMPQLLLPQLFPNCAQVTLCPNCAPAVP